MRIEAKDKKEYVMNELDKKLSSMDFGSINYRKGFGKLYFEHKELNVEYDVWKESYSFIKRFWDVCRMEEPRKFLHKWNIIVRPRYNNEGFEVDIYNPTPGYIFEEVYNFLLEHYDEDEIIILITYPKELNEVIE